MERVFTLTERESVSMKMANGVLPLDATVAPAPSYCLLPAFFAYLSI